MSCRRRTTVLRIPASALGMKTRREWENFLREHEDEYDMAVLACVSHADTMELLGKHGIGTMKI